MSKVVKGIGKAVKGVVKGVGKAVKGIVKGVGKVFDKVFGSDFGKILLAGGALFLGGAAMGWWQGPGWLGGGAAAGAEGASTAQAVAAGADVAGKTVAAAEGAAAAGGASSLAPVTVEGARATTTLAAAQGGGAAAGGAAGGASAAQQVAQGAGSAAKISPTTGALQPVAGPTATIESAKSAGSIFKSVRDMVGGVGSWAKDNPLLAASSLSFLGGALSPTDMDQRLDYERDLREEQQRNLNVGGIDVGILDRPEVERTFTPTNERRANEANLVRSPSIRSRIRPPGGQV